MSKINKSQPTQAHIVLEMPTPCFLLFSFCIFFWHLLSFAWVYIFVVVRLFVDVMKIITFLVRGL